MKFKLYVGDVKLCCCQDVIFPELVDYDIVTILCQHERQGAF